MQKCRTTLRLNGLLKALSIRGNCHPSPGGDAAMIASSSRLIEHDPFSWPRMAHRDTDDLIIERFSHFSSQRGGQEGFPQEISSWGHSLVREDDRFRISRHIQDLDQRTFYGQTLRHFQPTHSRHENIRQQQLNVAVELAAGSQRRGAVTRHQYPIAPPLEHFSNDVLNRFLIINQQNCLGSR